MAKKDTIETAEIKLNNKRYSLRFSHEAVNCLENHLDISVLDFVERFQPELDKEDNILTKKKRMDYRTAAMTIWLCLQHHDVFATMTLEEFIVTLGKHYKSITWINVFDYAAAGKKKAYKKEETDTQESDNEKKKTIPKTNIVSKNN